MIRLFIALLLLPLASCLTSNQERGTIKVQKVSLTDSTLMYAIDSLLHDYCLLYSQHDQNKPDLHSNYVWNVYVTAKDSYYKIGLKNASSNTCRKDAYGYMEYMGFDMVFYINGPCSFFEKTGVSKQFKIRITSSIPSCDDRPEALLYYKLAPAAIIIAGDTITSWKDYLSELMLKERKKDSRITPLPKEDNHLSPHPIIESQVMQREVIYTK